MAEPTPSPASKIHLAFPRPKAKHFAALLVAAFVGLTGYQAYEARRITKVIDDSFAIQKAQKDAAEAQAREPQRCPKVLSGLDHDVDMGVSAPCPNVKDGMCLTYKGETLSVQVWAQRCFAGRIQ